MHWRMVGPSDHRRFASAVQDRTPGGGALFSGGCSQPSRRRRTGRSPQSRTSPC